MLNLYWSTAHLYWYTHTREYSQILKSSCRQGGGQTNAESWATFTLLNTIMYNWHSTRLQTVPYRTVQLIRLFSPLLASYRHCFLIFYSVGRGQNRRRRRGNGSDTTEMDRGSGETSVRTTTDGGSGAAIRNRENPRRLMRRRRRKATAAAATRERKRMTKCWRRRLAEPTFHQPGSGTVCTRLQRFWLFKKKIEIPDPLIDAK